MVLARVVIAPAASIHLRTIVSLEILTVSEEKKYSDKSSEDNINLVDSPVIKRVLVTENSSAFTIRIAIIRII